MNLNTQDWKTFFLKDLYSIKMGNGFDKNKMSDDNGSVNFVSRVSYNNGVDIKVDYIEGVEPYPAGLLTVALGGSYLGSCFVQEEPFYTGQNVAVMIPSCEEMTHLVNIFITSLVRYESKVKYYAFGRELNTHINRDFNILLPVQHNHDGTPIIDNTYRYSEQGYVPDWQWMEEYIKSLHYKPLTTQNKVGQVLELKVDEWKEFRVRDILECDSTILSVKDELLDGDIPFVSRTAENNGVDGYVDVEASKVSKGNCITLGAEGIYSFYQADDFATGNKVYQMRMKTMNRYIALFLCTILNKEDYRYSYGRARILSKLKDEVIKLPADANGEPNWKFMEDYIKALPYGDRL